MEAVLVIGCALAMLWVADRIGVFLSNGAVVVLVRGFVSWLGGKLDPWPSGVQEEDRDRPWGGERRPQLIRVRPAVRAR